MFYGENTIEIRIDFSTADLGPPYHLALMEGDNEHEHVFATWLRAVSTEVGTLLRKVSLLSSNSVADQPAGLHIDMVWEEQNSRCLALFLVSHGVGPAFIKHANDPDGDGVVDPDLMSFKQHMDVAASLKTMWQTMPRETMFFAKTVAEKCVPVMERELPSLKAAYESTAHALRAANEDCYEKTRVAVEAMRRQYNRIGRGAPEHYREMQAGYLVSDWTVHSSDSELTLSRQQGGFHPSVQLLSLSLNGCGSWSKLEGRFGKPNWRKRSTRETGTKRRNSMSFGSC